jgi:hypothetical protein
MLKTLFDYGDLELEDFARKLICMGFVFHSRWNGVTTQLKEKVTSFLLGVHYCVHETNLAIKIGVGALIKGILQSFYRYFVHFLKNILEFQKLVEAMETLSNKFTKNVKTRCLTL